MLNLTCAEEHYWPLLTAQYWVPKIKKKKVKKTSHPNKDMQNSKTLKTRNYNCVHFSGDVCCMCDGHSAAVHVYTEPTYEPMKGASVDHI